jgi:SAM-dependent methyltransferase
MFKEITECRACGSKDLQMVVDLGPQMVVDFVERRESVREAPVPLQLSFCKNCKLVQLMHEVNRDRLYKKFWYKSGINEQMRQALRDVANKALTLTDVNFADHILDIGCNDGTLLELFDHRYFRVGVDPCRELVHEANHTGRLDVGVVGYFGLNPGILRFAPYKIITAIAMFYDVPNPEVFLQHCKQVLHADGTIVIQMNYLKMMLEEMSFDNICHEHLMYYSLMSLEPIIQRAGLEISGAETNDVNGGSLRLYLTHAGKGFSGYRTTAAYRVSLHAQALQLLKQECMMELDKPEAYLEYAGRIAMTMEALRLALAKREARR